MNRKKVVGIFSHVDAGKTTLTEALLYKSGQINELGNVNKGTTFFDHNPIERKRGITFLSKPIFLEEAEVTLIDTPGHMDLTFEMERSLQVTDLAILLVSAAEGVTGYTETIFELCQIYQIPLLVFMNKCDLDTSRPEKVLQELEALDERFIEMDHLPFSQEFQENWALLDEDWFEKMAESTPEEQKEEFNQAVLARKIFPVIKGSAAQTIGVDMLLNALSFIELPQSELRNVGQVYKIVTTKDQRYHLVKIVSGEFSVKDKIYSPQHKEVELKVNQLFILNGEKVTPTQSAKAGDIVGIQGLGELVIGDKIASMDVPMEKVPAKVELTREPALEVQVLSEMEVDELLQNFKGLEMEDPSLHVRYVEETKEIFVQVVGPIQMEYLQESYQLRFNQTITFSKPSVLYKETLISAIRGNGHYEPLRHYAEVALWMEPGEEGQGIVLKNNCTLEQLSANYQKGILHHLQERVHRGVLIGAPLTDVTITLLAGAAHNPETKGGDFREATYRAVRQGLMKAKNQVLEPWYQVKIAVPTEMVGKVVTDIQKYQGELLPIEEVDEEMTTIEALVPVATFMDYPIEFASFTKNKGRLTAIVKGYYPCHNQDEVVAVFNYDPESDLYHTPNSIFFTKGKGYDVKWQDVDSKCHIQLKDR